ncbi:[protein-PII] uridylyltransferase [Thauera linaloolentis]|uniref:Bifunctional uridylyltransferase/uridylyl-removing enzyme n=1 Tax=Thauera linaloolentis (strain DSM 12138 / JCM 21573 / CCUG 41526 / CIP 105981 / IAM 15112 / NBRC 102519 / 47Lol) TaxID=1123367 RepID=N6ZDP8_THAL4|nr:[protein-PII] uridylyltransferase [Thauera linaloolentis]ENO90289.1 PII uridylyl-transferase [Thauera linaloolentis 47Lol = DSM 12138]MCM8566222.1 [protein-PII] uridylyltransferase [Thauera linaloolentis]
MQDALSTRLQTLISDSRRRLGDGTRALRAAYEAHPRTSVVLEGRAKLVDIEVVGIWQACQMPAEAALIAVGGYGRGELFPASDVDLLVLLPRAADAGVCERLSAMVGALWDIGLEIGHAVRTVDECIQAAEDDITVQTNLLEARFLAGDAERFAELEQRYYAALDVREFYKAKQLEQEQRYARFNDSPYSLEPDCKDSPGGLRDLQMLGWIARAAGLGRNWRDLARRRLITGGEASELRSVERFLQHLRIRLHYLAGRAEDRVLFDHQEKLARIMGIDATANRRASEVLMQRYYINAKMVTQLNTVLLQNYGTVIFPDRGAAIVINPRFQVVRELLDLRHEDVFERYPSALLECFLLLQQRSELKGMTARTLRALWINRNRINAAFRADPAHRALFLQILQQKRGIVHAFRRMNEYGILSRYLPAWRRIIGQMQHDLFHVYTVDQHILTVLRNVRRFTMGEHAHEYPLMTRLILAFERHWLLYVAALFHDIAKGRGGDHSRLGMVDARDFCVLHSLDEDDTALVVWLVEQHLTMSHFAQKEDTSDPEVVQRFAAIMGSERRLIALYLLTHADIRGTSPKVWNGWKGKLLEDLFFAAQRLLRGATPQQALGMDDRLEDARRLLRFHGLRPGVEERLWSELDAVYFMRHSAEEIAWHTRLLYFRPDAGEPVVKARVAEDEHGVQVMVFTPDQKELFVRLTGFFGRLGFTILDAKVHTTRHGHALDSFMLQDPGGEASYRDVITLIEHELAAYLARPDALDRPSRGRMSRQVKHFPITPQVSIRADEAGRHYILSLTAADRPGLLFDIAETLAGHGIRLHTAKIATLGERVEDTFLLTGAALAQDAQLLRVERELLERLQV